MPSSVDILSAVTPVGVSSISSLPVLSVRPVSATVIDALSATGVAVVDNRSSMVDVSALGQALTAMLAYLTKKISQSSSSTSASDIPTTFASVTTTAQLFVTAFNTFLTSATDTTQNPLTFTSDSRLLQLMNEQTLTGTNNALLTSLSQLGITLQETTLADSSTQFTLDLNTLQTAYQNNPTATSSLLTQALQALAQAETQLINVQSTEISQLGLSGYIASATNTDAQAIAEVNASTNTSISALSTGSNTSSDISANAVAGSNISVTQQVLQQTLTDEILQGMIDTSRTTISVADARTTMADFLTGSPTATADGAESQILNLISDRSAYDTSGVQTEYSSQLLPSSDVRSGFASNGMSVVGGDNPTTAIAATHTASPAISSLNSSVSSPITATHMSGMTEAAIYNALHTQKNISALAASDVGIGNRNDTVGAADTMDIADIAQTNLGLALEAAANNSISNTMSMTPSVLVTSSELASDQVTSRILSQNSDNGIAANLNANTDALTISMSNSNADISSLIASVATRDQLATVNSTNADNTIGNTNPASTFKETNSPSINPSISAAVAAYKVSDAVTHLGSDRLAEHSTETVPDIGIIPRIDPVTLNPHEQAGQQKTNPDSSKLSKTSQDAAPTAAVDNIDVSA